MATRIEVSEANDPAEWDEDLCNLAGAHPLQCWAWGEAKEVMGERVVRLMLRHEGKIVAMAQVFGRKVTPLGVPLAWIPKGPAWDMETSVHREAAAALKRALAERGFRALAARPYAIPGDVSLGRKWPWSQASQTFWVDLRQPLEHIERALHPTWRSHRNRFFNRGGQVIDDPTEEALELLIRMHQDLAKRKGFLGGRFAGVHPRGLEGLPGPCLARRLAPYLPCHERRETRGRHNDHPDPHLRASFLERLQLRRAERGPE